MEVVLTSNKVAINKLRTEFPTNDINCSLFLLCSGCKLQKNVRVPPVWKEVVNFFTSKNITVELVSKEITEYRSKVKLAVRGSFLLPQIGLFKEGTHEVVDMPFCPLHYSVMNNACALIRKKITQYQIEPYQENGSKGRLKYIQMLVNRKINKIQVSFVFNADSVNKNEIEFMKDLYSDDSFFHSIWVNFFPGSSNTILGDNWKLFHGEEYFEQELLGVPFYFHPSCFSQAHLSIFEDMLRYVNFLVPVGASVLELYAGVGCIGLYIAQKSSKVIFVESSLHAEKCFKKTTSKLLGGISQKCTFFSSSVEDMVFPTEKIDVLIVDPPRKGLSRRCKEKISLLQPKQLIYVSCGPDSFMRDCNELLERGWVLNEARGFLLFPGTDHAEIIASFVRSL